MRAETLYFGDLTSETPYRDANGRVLANAVLTFWRSGTTEPLAVYADPELTTELSDAEGRVTADSGGVFPEIWLQPQDYRVRLEDERGALVWDVDPYVSRETAFDTRIMASGDDLLVQRSDPGSTDSFTAATSTSGSNMMHAPVIAYVPRADRWIVLSSTAAGGAPTNGPVRYSDDNGATWITPTSTPSIWFEHRNIFDVPQWGLVVTAGGQNRFESFWSDDEGETWNAAESIDPNDSGELYSPMRAAVYAKAARGPFVAGAIVAMMVTGSRLYRTFDGKNWVKRDTNVAVGGPIAFSPPLALFAMLSGGKIYTSPDAEDWTERATLTTTGLDTNGGAICWDFTQRAFIAVGAEGTLRSSNGIAWNVIGAAPTRRNFLFPSRRGVLYATWESRAGNAAISTSSFDYSADGGVTWQTGAFSQGGVFRAMAENVSAVELAGLPTRFLSPIYQALTELGRPNPARRFYFLAADDKRTPVRVYADAQLRSPLPNPLAPDAGGYFPPIYLDPDVEYFVADEAPDPTPAPVITALDPTEVQQGEGAFTLTVAGENFLPTSVVRWNGSARTTTYVSNEELKAAIEADDLNVTHAPTTAKVTVFTPAPGGGVSNAALIDIARRPVPEIDALVPTQITRGAEAFTLTVQGSGFVQDSVVRWNGSARTTTYVSNEELKAAIEADDVAAPGTAAVTVFNPPPGGGESEPATFTITPAETDWTPAQLGATLALWLDADDSESITLTEGAVSAWADKSGNARHATQATAANRPTVATEAINGRNAIRFDGTNDFLSISSFPTGASAYSIYAVLENNQDPPANAEQTGIWSFTGATLSSQRNSHHPSTDGVLYHNFGTTTRKTVGDPTPSLADPHLFNIDSAAGSWQARLNAEQIFTTSSNTVGMQATCLIGLSNATDNSRFYDGYFAEIVVCTSVLSEGDRQKVEGYLAHKWGIELPSGHPYEENPPEIEP